ncbi:hypothetical protein AD998_10930 [bacterium 336/3]|nr:hypothetical protein AD998_10930 [bacterium 336/3]
MPKVESEEEKVNKVYQEFEVAQNAEYEGGVIFFWNEFARNLIYPEKAKANKTEGYVYLQFMVNKEGNIEDIRIIKDIGDGCGEAAVQALKKTTKPWKPAQNKDGKPVKVKKVIPVNFKL